MKKLVSIFLLCIVFTQPIYASESEMNKQEMLRSPEVYSTESLDEEAVNIDEMNKQDMLRTPELNSEEVIDVEEINVQTTPKYLPIILTIIISTIVIGLISAFIIKFILSLRGKKDIIADDEDHKE